MCLGLLAVRHCRHYERIQRLNYHHCRSQLSWQVACHHLGHFLSPRTSHLMMMSFSTELQLFQPFTACFQLALHWILLMV